MTTLRFLANFIRCVRVESSFFIVVVCLLLSAGLTACGGGSSPSSPSPGATVTNVAIAPQSGSVNAGSTLPLEATAGYSDGSSKDVTLQATWISSDPSRATVSTLGVVSGTYGATAGSVTIKAIFGGLSNSVTLTVKSAGSGSGPLAVGPANGWVYLNGTLQMSATYTSPNGGSQDVTAQTTWSSSNPSKASVDATGQVHGLLGDGVVSITGTYQGNTDAATVTVSHSLLAHNTPLTDMTPGQTYMGFEGNLYENSSGSAPSDHDAAGITLGNQIQPLDLNGNPSPNGAIAFISVGLSNTSLEFGGFASYVADPSRSAQVNPRLAVLNGAKPGEAACAWLDPAQSPRITCTVPPFTSLDPQNQYDRVRDEVLATATNAPGAPPGCGTKANPCLSEKQVQAIWLKEADPAPEGSGFVSLCNVATPGCTNDVSTTEAYHFEQQLGQIVRAMTARYPNLKQVFLASRIYAGYIKLDASPEPYAYEYGFSVKWLIQAQIDQIRGQSVDSVAGDLDYNHGNAPWLAWGAYLWADGANPRGDGLVWVKQDYQANDYQHPSPTGVAKVDGLLFTFFTTSPYSPWFRP